MYVQRRERERKYVCKGESEMVFWQFLFSQWQDLSRRLRVPELSSSGWKDFFVIPSSTSTSLLFVFRAAVLTFVAVAAAGAGSASIACINRPAVEIRRPADSTETGSGSGSSF